MKKLVFFFVLLLTSYKSTLAATGCQYTSGYIYIVTGGSGGSGVPNYTYTGQSSERVQGSSYCVVVTGGANSCYINYSGGSAYGVLVNYSSLPCAAPIDSQLYILLIATTGFSFSFLRKNFK